ncbi:hypothetical protein L3X38_012675 [Prunus dulcis]|uniref:Uncharacterized protein n=1 Tax=Prunus dulcis TaxID=3755 RepID=A0AAD4ZGV5_PRUDU|nr:hypothetical protein L3X38_012675 [Prunus dulcis]
MKRYIRLKTVKEIWDALSTTFFDGTDEVQELDHRDTVVLPFDYDIKVHAKSIKRLRVYILLVGLDVEFDQVRGGIVGKTRYLGSKNPMLMFVVKLTEGKPCKLRSSSSKLQPW